MIRPKHGKRFSFTLILFILAALAMPSDSLAQDPNSMKTTVLSPDRSDTGEWTGTWYYKTRTDKWALWIRETDGVPELKFQYQDYDQGENFISDWTALSRYAAKGKSGYFKIDFKRRDANVIEGDWFWQLGVPEVDSSVRTETATIEMYRALRGRQLVLRFHDFERIYEGRKVYRLAAEQAWTFHKASRRLARWQELPF
jgi:hypothetical protein